MTPNKLTTAAQYCHETDCLLFTGYITLDHSDTFCINYVETVLSTDLVSQWIQILAVAWLV